ncbi:DUF4395 domain-containing protein [Nocardioides mesophilus]|uniref:DUF4395 domain-containing protein n=1 Tax=Nocardioides mesophilus TaxID=433659 RepID=A0A7G9REL6_9ACTN|nr:DUF4395 domain-containing protein [Nocardioides mesophilus]QNN54041.1 DUF4395 domain-containing protein [Nocardioides mesophilus]
MSSITQTRPASPAHRDASPAVRVDPRGPRFAASLTTLVLAAALLAAPSTLTVVLLAAQTVLFAVGAVAGIGRTPYGWLFRTFVRPRLAAPTELEDAAPPRFAQSVGLGFAVVALAGYLLGADLLGAIATGAALAAAFLNAAFGFCLGCEVYLLLKRLTGRAAVPQ